MDAFAPEIKLLSQSFCAVESRPSSSPPLGPIPLGPRGEERKVLSLQTTRRRRQRASSKSRAKCEKRVRKEGCKRADRKRKNAAALGSKISGKKDGKAKAIYFGCQRLEVGHGQVTDLPAGQWASPP